MRRDNDNAKLESQNPEPRTQNPKSAAGQVVISEPLAETLHLKEGGTITLPTPSGPQPFTIAGVFYDYRTHGPSVWMDISLPALLARHAPECGAGSTSRTPPGCPRSRPACKSAMAAATASWPCPTGISGTASCALRRDLRPDLRPGGGGGGGGGLRYYHHLPGAHPGTGAGPGPASGHRRLPAANSGHGPGGIGPGRRPEFWVRRRLRVGVVVITYFRHQQAGLRLDHSAPLHPGHLLANPYSGSDPESGRGGLPGLAGHPATFGGDFERGIKLDIITKKLLRILR